MCYKTSWAFINSCFGYFYFSIFSAIKSVQFVFSISNIVLRIAFSWLIKSTSATPRRFADSDIEKSIQYPTLHVILFLVTSLHIQEKDTWKISIPQNLKPFHTSIKQNIIKYVKLSYDVSVLPNLSVSSMDMCDKFVTALANPGIKSPPKHGVFILHTIRLTPWTVHFQPVIKVLHFSCATMQTAIAVAHWIHVQHKSYSV